MRPTCCSTRVSSWSPEQANRRRRSRPRASAQRRWQTAPGAAIRDSIWLFPAIEALHLLALALLGGAVLMLDLRLLGAGVASLPLPILERQTWSASSGSIAFSKGTVSFMDESSQAACRSGGGTFAA